MIVVDSNVLAARNLTSGRITFCEQVERIDPVWIAPPLWRYEFQNILAKTIRARQIMPNDAIEVWRVVLTRMSDNEQEPSAEKVIHLVAQHGIINYDANFIALAMEMSVLYVTKDGELHEKFPTLAIGMKDFVQQDHGGIIVRKQRATYRTCRNHGANKS